MQTVYMPIFYTCTVLLVAAIMIKARNMITANSIPDFHNWPQAGRGEDEGKCNRLTDFQHLQNVHEQDCKQN